MNKKKDHSGTGDNIKKNINKLKNQPVEMATLKIIVKDKSILCMIPHKTSYVELWLDKIFIKMF